MPVATRLQHLRNLLLTALQVALLAVVWHLADAFSHRFTPLLPAGVLGMVLVLLLLGMRILPRRHVAEGAGWLLREMLLFFIPAVIAIIQYPDLVWRHGLGVLAVIVISTTAVMASTTLAVEAVFRLQGRHRAPNSRP